MITYEEQKKINPVEFTALFSKQLLEEQLYCEVALLEQCITESNEVIYSNLTINSRRSSEDWSYWDKKYEDLTILAYEVIIIRKLSLEEARDYLNSLG